MQEAAPAEVTAVCGQSSLFTQTRFQTPFPPTMQQDATTIEMRRSNASSLYFWTQHLHHTQRTRYRHIVNGLGMH